MKISLRMLCVLTLFYNLYYAFGAVLISILQGVGVGGHWLEDYPTLKLQLMLVAGALLLFLFAHSVRLIMFYESARKIQFWLSATYPIFRIPLGILIVLAFPQYIVVLVASIVAGTAVDCGIALSMRAGFTRGVFKDAEDRRSLKYWARKNGFRGI